MSESSQFIPETKDAATVAAEAVDHARHEQVHAALAAILEKMADRFAAGQSVTAEQLLAEHPELKIDPEAAVRIVYEEFCLREEAGRTRRFGGILSAVSAVARRISGGVSMSSSIAR